MAIPIPPPPPPAPPMPPPPKKAATAAPAATNSTEAKALKTASSGLTKMKITAYEMDANGSMVNMTTLRVGINPETYKREFSPSNRAGGNRKNSRNSGKVITGAAGAILDRKIIEFKESVSFDLWFDGTGVIPNSGDIAKDLKWVEDNLVKYDKNMHATKYVKIAWGPLLFYGQLKTFGLTYKQFDPAGFPLRAVASLGFEEILNPDIRNKMKSPQSADLTHVRTVKAGDTLPMMCYRIYKSPHFYLKVAEANGLPNFTNIQPGQKIYFPPLV